MSIYNSDIHKFIKEYFSINNADIKIIDENYFNVMFEDGYEFVYTYNPKIASENSDVKLIAKGSREFIKIVKECQTKGCYSSVNISYSEESVKNSLRKKQCCNLCPYFEVCKDKNNCCDFCHYYKICNTNIKNGDFKKLGEVIESKPIQCIAFIFYIELSNDYLLSQKAKKRIVVIIDIKTGDVLQEVVIKDMSDLEIKMSEFNYELALDEYSEYHKKAIELLTQKLIPQMELFKQQIEGPLEEKINAVVDKYYTEYLENFTKINANELEILQKNALAYSSREIRGYTINNEFNLENVIIIETTYDKRELIYNVDGILRKVNANIFINRIDLHCESCGMEIDKGHICENGHLVCDECVDKCSNCGKVLCPICDDDGYICSTCGSVICENCVNECNSCEAIICNRHKYACCVCRNEYCIDCFEICTECDNNVCEKHGQKCKECDVILCPEHSSRCSVCNDVFCSEHILKCSTCGIMLCEKHAIVSNYSGKIVCSEHSLQCNKCNSIITKDEANICSKCGIKLCPNHIIICNGCGKSYCKNHISKCDICNTYYCDCTDFNICKICGNKSCRECINKDGICELCSNLCDCSNTEPALVAYCSTQHIINIKGKIMISKGKNKIIFLIKMLFSAKVITTDRNGLVINRKKHNFFDIIKNKLNLLQK